MKSLLPGAGISTSPLVSEREGGSGGPRFQEEPTPGMQLALSSGTRCLDNPSRLSPETVRFGLKHLDTPLSICAPALSCSFQSVVGASRPWIDICTLL
jgi:hypothetical protein